MSRRHLEEAILTSQMIENKLEPRFRFSRVDVFRTISPYAEFDEGVYSVQFTPNGKHVAVGTSSGAVRVYDLSSASAMPLEPMPAKFRFGLAVTCLRFQPPDHTRLVASSASGEIFSMRTDCIGFENILTEPNNETNTLDFSPGCRYLATAGKDANIRIYDNATLDCVNVMSSFDSLNFRVQNGHTMRIFCVRFSTEDPNLLFSAGWDNDVKMWDVRIGGSAVGSINGPHVCGDGLDLCGTSLLTCSWTCARALQLWDIRRMDLVCAIPCCPDGGVEFLYAGRFAENATAVVAGSGIQGLTAVSTTTGEIHGKIAMPSPAFALDSVLGGRSLAVGSSDGTVKIANMR